MAIDITKIIGETSDYDKKQQLEINKPKSWCKSVSAFANGYGGTLIFGITDDNEIVGIENPQFIAEKFSEIVNQRIDPVPDFHLSFQQYGDKTVMVVNIEPGTLTPYYYKGDGQLMAYKRIGNESVPVNVSALRELVLKGTHQTYDSLVTNYKFEDFAFTKLRSVFHARTGNTFGSEEYEAWGLVDKNGRLTNAGALLADESPIRHSRLFCTRWNGLDKANGLVDALDDVEISGSLVILLQEGLEFCRRNSRKIWYKTPNGRMELPDYPKDCVLEGLVNGLIHRSYLELGGEVHVDMYDNRIEISSPGGMVEGSPIQERDIMHITSRRRNPILADIFSRLRYMERRGSGFKKICFDYSNHKNYNENLHPKFYSDQLDFILTLYNLNYVEKQDETTLVPQSSPKFPKVPQSSPKYLSDLLNLIQEQPEATVIQYAQIIGVTERMIKKHLKTLKDLGAIRRIGSNRRGYWQITPTHEN